LIFQTAGNTRSGLPARWNSLKGGLVYTDEIPMQNQATTRTYFNAILNSTLFILPSLLIPRIQPLFDQFLLASVSKEQVKLATILFLCMIPVGITSWILTRTTAYLGTRAEGIIREKLNESSIALSWILAVLNGVIAFAIAIGLYVMTDVEITASIITAALMTSVSAVLSLMNIVGHFALLVKNERKSVISLEFRWLALTSIAKLICLYTLNDSAHLFLYFTSINVLEQVGLFYGLSRLINFKPKFQGLSKYIRRIQVLVSSEYALSVVMIFEPLAFAWSLAYFGLADDLVCYSLGYNSFFLGLAPLSAIIAAGSVEYAKIWRQKKEKAWDQVSKAIFSMAAIYSAFIIVASFAILKFSDLPSMFSDLSHTAIFMASILGIVPIGLCTVSWTILRVYEKTFDIAIMWGLSIYAVELPLLLQALSEDQKNYTKIAGAILIPKILFFTALVVRVRYLQYLRYRAERLHVARLNIACVIEIETDIGAYKYEGRVADISDSGLGILLRSEKPITLHTVKGRLIKNDHVVSEFTGKILNQKRHLFRPGIYRCGIEFDKNNTYLKWWEILENTTELLIA
jgi:hypothetical protein